MEKALLLPFPKFFDRHNANKLSTQEQKLRLFWSKELKRLAANPFLWQETLELLKSHQKDHSKAHPLATLAVDRDGQSLLHLAAIEEQIECIRLLSSYEELLERRNRFGLTPLELAQYLHRKEALKTFSPNTEKPLEFHQQPNIEFEADFPHLHYLSQPIYDTPHTLHEILKHTSKAKEKNAIGQDRIWMGIYYNMEIEKKIYPRLTVRLVNQEVGYGVFARERILPHTFLGEYTGKIEERKKIHQLKSNYAFLYSSWHFGRKKYVIDAENKGNFTRFINHSDRPNTEAVCIYWRGLPRMVFISVAEILPGQQILFDYGESFWKEASSLTKQHL